MGMGKDNSVSVSSMRKFKTLCGKPYRTQAKWFVTNYWASKFEGSAENRKQLFLAYCAMCTLDGTPDGCALGPLKAHRFLEKCGSPLEWSAFHKDSNNNLSLAAYLVARFDGDIDFLVNAPQPVDAGLAEAEAELAACQKLHAACDAQRAIAQGLGGELLKSMVAAKLEDRAMTDARADAREEVREAPGQEEGGNGVGESDAPGSRQLRAAWSTAVTALPWAWSTATEPRRGRRRAVSDPPRPISTSATSAPAPPSPPPRRRAHTDPAAVEERLDELVERHYDSALERLRPSSADRSPDGGEAPSGATRVEQARRRSILSMFVGAQTARDPESLETKQRAALQRHKRFARGARQALKRAEAKVAELKASGAFFLRGQGLMWLLEREIKMDAEKSTREREFARKKTKKLASKRSSGKAAATARPRRIRRRSLTC